MKNKILPKGLAAVMLISFSAPLLASEDGVNQLAASKISGTLSEEVSLNLMHKKEMSELKRKSEKAAAELELLKVRVEAMHLDAEERKLTGAEQMLQAERDNLERELSLYQDMSRDMISDVNPKKDAPEEKAVSLSSNPLSLVFALRSYNLSNNVSGQIMVDGSVYTVKKGDRIGDVVVDNIGDGFISVRHKEEKVRKMVVSKSRAIEETGRIYREGRPESLMPISEEKIEPYSGGATFQQAIF